MLLISAFPMNDGACTGFAACALAWGVVWWLAATAAVSSLVNAVAPAMAATLTLRCVLRHWSRC